MPKKLQQQLAFACGIMFVVVLLILALVVPNPTPFQYEVFRAVLSLAVAGVAAMIPGFVELTVSDWLRAGGALAVFFVVYFYNPASLVVQDPEPDPTAMFPIVLACKTPERVVIDTYSFPFSDIQKNAKHHAINKLIAQLPSQRCDQLDSSIYRMKDEELVLPSGDTTATSGGNLGIIVLPKEVVDEFGDSHLAFTKVHSYTRQLEQQ